MTTTRMAMTPVTTSQLTPLAGLRELRLAFTVGVLARLASACLVGGDAQHWHVVGRAALAGTLDDALGHGFPVSAFGVAWAAACAALTDNAHLFAFLDRVPALVTDVALMGWLWRRGASLTPFVTVLFALCGASVLAAGTDGSTTESAAVLCFFAATLIDRERPLAAGVLVGLACTMSLLALPFAAGFALRGRARFLLPALALALPGVAFLAAHSDALAAASIADGALPSGITVITQVLSAALPDTADSIEHACCAVVLLVQLLAAVALGERARKRGDGALATGALIACATLVLAVGTPVNALIFPLLFLAVIDQARALAWAITASIASVLAHTAPLIANRQGNAGLIGLASLGVGVAWVLAAELLLDRVGRWGRATREALRVSRVVSWLGRIAPSLLFIGWCAVTLTAVLHHEPWRDEADTWLVARDLSLLQIWKLAPYVGTPILWHLVEVPFARAGLPYGTEEIVHWPIAAFAAALIAFRAPFTVVTRGLILFSYYFVFEYSVVARCYALTIVFILLACILYPRRMKGSLALALVVAGAANTSPFGLLFAVAFGGVLALELWPLWRTRTAPRAALFRFALMVAGTMLGAAQLVPRPTDGQVTAIGTGPGGLMRAFLAGHWPFGNVAVREVLAFISVCAVLWLLRNAKQAVRFYLAFGGLLSLLFLAVHVGFVRHWGFYVVDAIAALWLMHHEIGGNELAGMCHADLGGRATRGALFLLCAQMACWVVRGGEMVDNEINKRFSNAAAMAQYIKDNHLEKRIIAAHSPTSGEALLPYLPGTKFWYAAINEWGASMKWNESMEKGGHRPGWDVALHTAQQFPRWNDDKDGVLWLVATAFPSDMLPALGYRLVHEEAEHVCSSNGERYYLYEPIPGAVQDTSRIPPPPPTDGI